MRSVKLTNGVGEAAIITVITYNVSPDVLRAASTYFRDLQGLPPDDSYAPTEGVATCMLVLKGYNLYTFLTTSTKTIHGLTNPSHGKWDLRNHKQLTKLLELAKVFLFSYYFAFLSFFSMLIISSFFVFLY